MRTTVVLCFFGVVVNTGASLITITASGGPGLRIDDSRVYDFQVASPEGAQVVFSSVLHPAYGNAAGSSRVFAGLSMRDRTVAYAGYSFQYNGALNDDLGPVQGCNANVQTGMQSGLTGCLMGLGYGSVVTLRASVNAFSMDGITGLQPQPVSGSATANLEVLSGTLTAVTSPATIYNPEPDTGWLLLFGLLILTVSVYRRNKLRRRL